MDSHGNDITYIGGKSVEELKIHSNFLVLKILSQSSLRTKALQILYSDRVIIINFIDGLSN